MFFPSKPVLRVSAPLPQAQLVETRLQNLVHLQTLVASKAVRCALACASDHPVLDCAYKLQSYAGGARRKRSTGKATWPGIKQVFRRTLDGTYAGDTVALADEPIDGRPLLVPAMRAGRRVTAPEPLAAIRARLRGELDALPAALKELPIAPPYPVEISPAIRALAAQLDAGGQ